MAKEFMAKMQYGIQAAFYSEAVVRIAMAQGIRALTMQLVARRVSEVSPLLVLAYASGFNEPEK
ncbi:MAG TPA: hypothetical protein VFI31_22825 [Pirellulales bacterium]|nr:hypothetical protein [Pirellulales bacterium]